MTLVPTEGSKNSIQLPKDDVRMELRVKNNLLYSAIMSKYGSVLAFCKDAKKRGYEVRQQTVGKLLNFKMSPFVEGDPKEFKSVCQLIERALGIPAEDLFPVKLYRKLGVNRQVITFNSSHGPIALASRQAHLIPAGIEVHPEVRVIDNELKEQLEGVLKTLPFREREVLKLYYGIGDGYTYTVEEIGRVFKITRERVKTVISKAIRKLQKPVRANMLLEFLPPMSNREKKKLEELEEKRKELRKKHWAARDKREQEKKNKEAQPSQ